MQVMDQSLRERAAKVRLLVLDVDGVLTDGKLYYDHEGRELKAFHSRDGLGIKALQLCGIETAVISGRKSAALGHRMEQLKIRHVHQGCKDKLSVFLELLEETGLDAGEVCFAGDDWIDLPVLLRAGLAVSVADAEERVKENSHWITKNNGGHGAVREICNLILAAQQKEDFVLDRILSP